MSSQLVSIIIPAHNRTALLRECLNSVAQQTYSNIEVILVDDSSEENLQEVLNSVDWPSTYSYQYIRTDENIGPGAARDLGRQVAQGAFINYLDSDDLLHEEKIQLQVEKLQKHPKAGMCYCTSKNVFASTGVTRIRKWSNYTVEQFLPIVLYFRPWGTSACLWTREATDTIGSWVTEWTWEDKEYDVRAGCHDINIVHVDKVLCYYNKDGPHRLGKRTKKESLAKRIPCLVEIEKNLKKYGKLTNPIIKEIFSYNLYCLIFQLFDLNARKFTIKPLKMILELEDTLNKIWVITIVIFTMGYIFHFQKIASYLGRRLAFFLYKPHIRSNQFSKIKLE